MGSFKLIFLVKWIVNPSSEKSMQIFNLLFDLGNTIMSDNQIAHSTSSMNSISSQEFVQVLFDHNNIIGVHLIYIFWWTRGIIMSNSILCSTMWGLFSKIECNSKQKHIKFLLQFFNYSHYLLKIYIDSYVLYPFLNECFIHFYYS